MLQETCDGTLVQEDTLKEEMAIHSNILAWKIPWTEEPGGLQSMGLQESDTLVTKPPPPEEKKDVMGRKVSPHPQFFSPASEMGIQVLIHGPNIFNAPFFSTGKEA